ncbi:hypothetical protein ACFFWD_01685 [Bradyrhizobium erythrophlei]|uniref:hypothetical protein n=1 Tax=Bradyrhizobium erythrophlei TaxID=1437360 RepID=UPI0035EA3DED
MAQRSSAKVDGSKDTLNPSSWIFRHIELRRTAVIRPWSRSSRLPSPIVANVPGLGERVQAIKAGILEIANVLVVNKADLPLAGRAVCFSAGSGRRSAR